MKLSNAARSILRFAVDHYATRLVVDGTLLSIARGLGSTVKAKKRVPGLSARVAEALAKKLPEIVTVTNTTTWQRSLYDGAQTAAVSVNVRKARALLAEIDGPTEHPPAAEPSASPVKCEETPAAPVMVPCDLVTVLEVANRARTISDAGEYSYYSIQVAHARGLLKLHGGQTEGRNASYHDYIITAEGRAKLAEFEALEAAVARGDEGHERDATQTLNLNGYVWRETCVKRFGKSNDRRQYGRLVHADSDGNVITVYPRVRSYGATFWFNSVTPWVAYASHEDACTAAAWVHYTRKGCGIRDDMQSRAVAFRENTRRVGKCKVFSFSRDKAQQCGRVAEEQMIALLWPEADADADEVIDALLLAGLIGRDKDGNLTHAHTPWEVNGWGTHRGDVEIALDAFQRNAYKPPPKVFTYDAGKVPQAALDSLWVCGYDLRAR